MAATRDDEGCLIPIRATVRDKEDIMTDIVSLHKRLQVSNSISSLCISRFGTNSSCFLALESRYDEVGDNKGNKKGHITNNVDDLFAVMEPKEELTPTTARGPRGIVP